MSIIPNPLTHDAEIFLSSANSLTHPHLQITDALGRIAADKYFAGERLVLRKETLSNGVYFYSLMDNQRIILTGKLIVE